MERCEQRRSDEGRNMARQFPLRLAAVETASTPPYRCAPAHHWTGREGVAMKKITEPGRRGPSRDDLLVSLTREQTKFFWPTYSVQNIIRTLPTDVDEARYNASRSLTGSRHLKRWSTGGLAARPTLSRVFEAPLNILRAQLLQILPIQRILQNSMPNGLGIIGRNHAVILPQREDEGIRLGDPPGA
jgi:hypothetical protein